MDRMDRILNHTKARSIKFLSKRPAIGDGFKGDLAFYNKDLYLKDDTSWNQFASISHKTKTIPRNTLLNLEGPHGYVGIGTSAPSSLLHLKGIDNLSLKMEGTAITNDEGAWLMVTARKTDTTTDREARIAVTTNSNCTNAVGAIRLDAEDGAANYLWVDNDNKLRISTTFAHIGTTNGTIVGDQS